MSAKSDHNRLKWADLSLKDLIFNFTFSFGLYCLLANKHLRLPSSNILFSLNCLVNLSKILLQWSFFVERTFCRLPWTFKVCEFCWTLWDFSLMESLSNRAVAILSFVVSLSFIVRDFFKLRALTIRLSKYYLGCFSLRLKHPRNRIFVCQHPNGCFGNRI